MLLARTARPRRLLAATALAVLIIFAGCATIQETPQQAYTWAMYEQGSTRIPDVRMDPDDPDGPYHFRNLRPKNRAGST